MKRSLTVALLALAGLVGRPAPAAADITFFLGMTPTPHVSSVRGAAFGVSLIVVGFEFEYALSREDPSDNSPGLQTGMFNFMVMTPTSVQLYATVGGGVYQERLGSTRVTNVGTNLGGGVKFPLVGPLKVRVDYRVLALRGNPLYSRPQRLYVGINWAF